ncbi:hypothetical protein H0H92_001729 [Tricholoma furcatifolium]|nr:hypothetical protein H0H92_001729 [Tricholoma furcatifolium]
MSRKTEEDEMAKVPVFILLSDGLSSSGDEDGASDRLQEKSRELVKPATSHALKNHATGSDNVHEGEVGRASSIPAASDDDDTSPEAE